MDIRIRQAVRNELEGLFRLDPLAKEGSGRRTQIERAVLARECWVASEEDEQGVPIGYGCLDKSFFAQWFIPLIVVSAEHRRIGVASRILAGLEHQASAKKIFTSTNASNAPMRRLLARAGYEPSGEIDNLDFGDPELVFVKFFDG